MTYLQALATALALVATSASLLAGPDREVPPPTLVEEEVPLFTGSLGVAWDSKYVTEGRDNLEEGGLVSTALEVSALGFTAGAWYGTGYDSDYGELNLGIEYGIGFAGFQAYAGYTYLYFTEDEVDDHEFSVGLAYTEIGWLIPAVDYVFCESAHGSFIEFSLASEIPLVQDADGEPRWLLVPMVILGVDMGYSTEEHDGANHVQLQLGTEYALTSNLALGAYIAQTFALEDVESDGGDDLFFGGVSLTVGF